jgi:hypothetical protein
MFIKAANGIPKLPFLSNVIGNGYTAFDAQIRHQRIAEIAYYKAENRGFHEGHAVKDWLEAEAEAAWFEESE